MREEPTPEDLEQFAQLKKDNEEFYRNHPPHVGLDACPFCYGKKFFAFADGIPCRPYACFHCYGLGKR